jgi:hypothetical protein
MADLPPPEVPVVGGPPAKDVNLGVLTEIPMSTRLTEKIRKAIGFYFKLRPVLIALIIIASMWIVSIPAREEIDGWWFDVTIFAALLAVVEIVGYARTRKAVSYWVARQALGKPAFGDAGGVGARLLRATFRSAPDVLLTFDAQDRELMDRLSRVDEKVTPAILRHRFVETQRLKGVGESSLEALWAVTWERISGFSVAGTTYAKVRREYPDAIPAIPYWLTASTSTAALVDFFVLASLWFGYRWAAGTGSAVSIVELVIFFGFLLASATFVHRAYRAGEMLMRIPQREWLSKHGVTDNELLLEVDALRGLKVKPTEVRLGPRYFKELVAVSARVLTTDLALRTLATVTLIGTAAGVGLLFGGSGALWETYKRIMFVVIVAASGLLCSFYLVSVVIQDVRKTLAPVVSGLVGAGLPLLGQYLLTGKIGDNPGAVRTSIILGMFGVGATALAEVVKVRFAAKSRP